MAWDDIRLILGEHGRTIIILVTLPSDAYFKLGEGDALISHKSVAINQNHSRAIGMIFYRTDLAESLDIDNHRDKWTI